MLVPDHENTPDELDRAAALTEAKTTASIKDIQRLAAPEQVQLEDGSWPEPDCRLCGDPLPPARLALGYATHVECKEREERRKKRGA